MHRPNGDDRNGGKDRNNDKDDRCQVSPPVSQPVGDHHHHHGDQDNGDQGGDES
jgi:hypothetical protein